MQTMLSPSFPFWSTLVAVILLHTAPIQAVPSPTDSTLYARNLLPAWDPKSNPYPSVRRDDVSYTYQSTASKGNVSVADPYNYLEPSPASSKEVQSFMEKQAAYFKGYTQNMKDIEAVRASIKSAGNYDELQFPQAFGSKEKPLYTFYYREIDKESRSYYVATQADLEQAYKSKFSPIPGKIVLDEASLGSDIYTYFQNISPDGKKFLYRTMVKSSKKPGTIHVRDISDIFTSSKPPKDYPEQITGNSDTSDGWTLDSNGFFYLHNDHDYADGTDTVLYHKIGTPVSDDIVVAKADKDAYESFIFQLSNDKKFIVLFVSTSSDKSRVYAASLDQPISSNMKWISIEPEEDLQLEYVTNLGNEFYFVANYDNESNEVVKYFVDSTKAVQVALGKLKKLKSKAKIEPTVIPEDKSALIDRFTTFDTDKMLLCYTQDAKRNFYIYDLKSGKRIQHVLPDFVGSSSAITSLASGTDMFLWSWTFNTPEQLYHIKWNQEQNSATSDLVFEAKLKSIDLSQFTVELKYATSKDSTKIPFHLFYRKGIKFDGTRPAMLNFFGAFRVIWLPFYDASYMTWVNDYDAIYVEPYPRGGGEVKAESWHQAGMLGKKQNTLDDVNAVIQYLIDNKIAAKGKIVMYGQFAGSTATMAVVNQGPEGNIGAVILADALYGSYGEYDLLRLDTVPGTSRDVAEYGDPHNPDAFDWLYKISPLHNVNKTKIYPAVMFQPGNDTLSNWHGRKMVAQLQYDLPNNPKPFLFNSPDQALTDDENVEQRYSFPIAFASHVLELQRKSQ
ncbi:prolyl oligopeptidase [Meira miltonrushii]|uniref:Prolyl endopeptidase n=1 Tax=Meira miltonrushii TaxID=1280837 RepID=A0A316VBH3_9BASI|nr:prolyl oligopeptidase [Meira miltonrushii]PWN34997.1 prolyl oligopeptidase [Meira miltonrushii]